MQCTRGIHHWASYAILARSIMYTESPQATCISYVTINILRVSRPRVFLEKGRHENDAVIPREHVTVSKKILQD